MSSHFYNANSSKLSNILLYRARWFIYINTFITIIFLTTNSFNPDIRFDWQFYKYLMSSIFFGILGAFDNIFDNLFNLLRKLIEKIANKISDMQNSPDYPKSKPNIYDNKGVINNIYGIYDDVKDSDMVKGATPRYESLYDFFTDNKYYIISAILACGVIYYLWNHPDTATAIYQYVKDSLSSFKNWMISKMSTPQPPAYPGGGNNNNNNPVGPDPLDGIPLQPLLPDVANGPQGAEGVISPPPTPPQGPVTTPRIAPTVYNLEIFHTVRNQYYRFKDYLLSKIFGRSPAALEDEAAIIFPDGRATPPPQDGDWAEFMFNINLWGWENPEQAQQIINQFEEHGDNIE